MSTFSNNNQNIYNTNSSLQRSHFFGNITDSYNVSADNDSTVINDKMFKDRISEAQNLVHMVQNQYRNAKMTAAAAAAEAADSFDEEIDGANRMLGDGVMGGKAAAAHQEDLAGADGDIESLSELEEAIIRPSTVTKSQRYVIIN